MPWPNITSLPQVSYLYVYLFFQVIVQNQLFSHSTKFSECLIYTKHLFQSWDQYGEPRRWALISVGLYILTRLSLEQSSLLYPWAYCAAMVLTLDGLFHVVFSLIVLCPSSLLNLGPFKDRYLDEIPYIPWACKICHIIRTQPLLKHLFILISTLCAVI